MLFFFRIDFLVAVYDSFLVWVAGNIRLTFLLLASDIVSTSFKCWRRPPVVNRSSGDWVMFK